MTLSDRLLSLLDHLGIQRAVLATQMAADVAGLALAAPERIAGLMLCTPVRLEPSPFDSISDRLVMISGDGGLSAEVTSRAAARLTGARRIVLDGYQAPGWADVAADRGDALVAALRLLPKGDVPRDDLSPGRHDGITYSIAGRGPAVILMPFFLAPSQWEPIVPALAQDHTVIVLGGRHLGGVAALEDRASGHSYQAMVRTLIDAMAPRPGETILDVGCGSGALDRLVVRWTGGRNPITATDLNPFLLREAAVLAVEDRVDDTIHFREANAESLPFPDNSFDCAFTVTVLEECDADRALRELHRVVRPGGRVGVIVRSIDLPQWWHLDIPDALRAKVDIPPQSVAAQGVADASLYRRMRNAGFTSLRCFPTLVTFDQPEGPIWKYREDHVLAQLSAEEAIIWRDATRSARDAGLLFMANPLHCAVGTVG